MNKINDTKKEKNITGWGNEEFLRMCSWIEKELMGYTGTQRLHKTACLRLQGLRKGQEVANNSQMMYGEYPLDVVFNTFKANKYIILKAIKGKTFGSEDQKMAYICAIVSNRINDMYTRMKNAKKSEEKSEKIDVGAQNSEAAEYQRQTEEVINSTFEEIW